MFRAPQSPYLVPFDGKFRIKRAATQPTDDGIKKKELKRKLVKQVTRFAELQRMLYADNRYALLLLFQAMDAAGKDSTIRAVTSGVDAAGFQVFSFKQPSAMELDHDFLWRTTKHMPERGRVGVFNRSYYEEVLVVRVHPEFLQHQRLPKRPPLAELWQQRYRSIRDLERHMAVNGTLILKFFLNVSRDEQRRRFLSRLDVPEKNWKFSASDVREREYWNDYMRAYEDAINATACKHAPWYAIPADNKPYMRYTVARIIVDALESLDIAYPKPTTEHLEELKVMRTALSND